MKKRIISLLLIALFCGSSAQAQKWEFVIEHVDNDSPRFKETVPLDDGTIAVPYYNYYPGSTGSFSSFQPGILLLSSEGEELMRKSYVKPAFWGYPPHLLWNEEGEMYMLSEYNPDHDTTSANYFLNFDNPPDYSILGLYKLDDGFEVVESYEHQIPIDTFPCPGLDNGFVSNSEYSGHIYVFTAIVDENTIVGGYMKTPTADYHNPRGHDSIFFFRMAFDGMMMERKGYDVDQGTHGFGGGLNWSISLMSTQIFKTEEGFVFFTNENYPIAFDGKEGLRFPGHAYFLDDEFNLIEEKLFKQRPGLDDQVFQYPTFVASNHNSMYLSTCFWKNGGNGQTGCALYEYDLGPNRTNELPILRYKERYGGGRDYTAQRQGVCLDADNNLFFAYSPKQGEGGMAIEYLFPDFDTIARLYYDLRPNSQLCRHAIQTICVDDNQDVLLTFNSHNPGVGGSKWSTITKFPGKAFLSIDEAQANGLHAAVAYPNPGRGLLNIGTGLKDARVEVYNLHGQLVHAENMVGGVASIVAESWPAGVYCWKVYATRSTSSSGSEVLVESGEWVKE